MVVMVEILVAAVAIEAAGLRHGGYGVMSLLPWILFFFLRGILPWILTSSYRVKEAPNDPLDVPYDLKKV
jgi:hypothetical protein